MGPSITLSNTTVTKHSSLVSRVIASAEYDCLNPSGSGKGRGEANCDRGEGRFSHAVQCNYVMSCSFLQEHDT